MPTIRPRRDSSARRELANLTIAIGLMNAYNRIAIGFRRGPAPTNSS
jgi:hypothetical protein